MQVDRYVGATVLRAILVVLGCLLVVVTVFTLVDELSDLTPGYTEAHALRYILYSTPRRTTELVPYAGFIGALVGLGLLAGNSELTVFRASGVTLWRLFGAATVPMLVILGGSVAVAEWLAPAAEDAAARMKLSVRHDSDDGTIASTTWYRDGGTMTSVGGYRSDGVLLDVRQYEVVDGKLLESRRAGTAVHLPEDGHWELRNVVETRFADDRTVVREYDALPWRTETDPALLSAVALFDPNKLPLAALTARIDYMVTEGLDANRYRVAFWARLYQPAAAVGLVLVALGIVVGPLRESGLGARLAVGIAVGVTLKYVTDLFGPISLVFGIPAWLAMLMPVLACWLGGAWLVRRV